MDLKKQSKYRVTLEESYYHTSPLDKASPDFPLYYQVILGRYGEIYWGCVINNYYTCV